MPALRHPLMPRKLATRLRPAMPLKPAPAALPSPPPTMAFASKKSFRSSRAAHSKGHGRQACVKSASRPRGHLGPRSAHRQACDCDAEGDEPQGRRATGSGIPYAACARSFAITLECRLNLRSCASIVCGGARWAAGGLPILPSVIAFEATCAPTCPAHPHKPDPALLDTSLRDCGGARYSRWACSHGPLALRGACRR